MFLFFCLLSSSAYTQDNSIMFHGSKIEIPEGFSELSAKELAAFKTKIFNRPIMKVYEKRNDPSDLERIIIYFDSLQGTKNLKFEQLVKIKLGVIKESNIVFNEVKVDPINHYVSGKSIVTGDTSMFGFSVDEYGIMGFQFDKSTGINESTKEQFENILKSTKHKSPYKYIPREIPEAEDAKKDEEISGWFMALGFAAMVLVWFVRKYARNK